ncbi:hypothetical protein ACWEPC_15975 [Nonomuraea sp. NPDC004297]
MALTDGYRREQQAARGLDAVITGGVNLADNADALRARPPGDALPAVGRLLPPRAPFHYHRLTAKAP